MLYPFFLVTDVSKLECSSVEFFFQAILIFVITYLQRMKHLTALHVCMPYYPEKSLQGENTLAYLAKLSVVLQH
jgi:hypothetical protein